jgi:uncharacterized protein with HEPN domain
MPDDLDRIRPHLWLDVMFTAAKDALSFVEGLDRAAYIADRKSQHAVSMALIRIGETATKLIKARPDLVGPIDLKSMSSLRNRIAHGYDDVDHMIVWTILVAEIPALVAALPAILAEYDSGPTQ